MEQVVLINDHGNFEWRAHQRLLVNLIGTPQTPNGCCVDTLRGLLRDVGLNHQSQGKDVLHGARRPYPDEGPRPTAFDQFLRFEPLQCFADRRSRYGAGLSYFIFPNLFARSKGPVQNCIPDRMIDPLICF